MPAPYREAEKNLKDTAYKLRSSAQKAKISMKITFQETGIRLIYNHRREGEIPTDWILHTKFDPMNIKKSKQATKLPDLFRGKCVYAQLNKDAETPEALKELFVQGLEQVNYTRRVANTKQAVAIHFKTVEEAKKALDTKKNMKVDCGFRLSIL